MYTSQPETATVTSSYAESTKYVADILSSMANGGVETPTSLSFTGTITKRVMRDEREFAPAEAYSVVICRVEESREATPSPVSCPRCPSLAQRWRRHRA
ncbi:hypothetical protein ElyMa_006872600 [Elysia marginata]|uniref:Uncharacterized protein n=1 Tax=Elysia marginata TaxID=1093978 RepID=A0AAV4J9Q7_9GAST|nr:hypothetical protein ElyMa_006872600 [Elysia marginata]